MSVLEKPVTPVCGSLSSESARLVMPVACNCAVDRVTTGTVLSRLVRAIWLPVTTISSIAGAAGVAAGWSCATALPIVSKVAAAPIKAKRDEPERKSAWLTVISSLSQSY